MTSPVVVETASTVANLVTSLLTVPRRRSQGEVVVGVHATSVARKVISQGIVLLSLLVAVGTASIVANLVTSAPTAWKKRSPEEVVAVEPVMDVEKKVISRETVLRRSAVEEVVVDVSIVSFLRIHRIDTCRDSMKQNEEERRSAGVPYRCVDAKGGYPNLQSQYRHKRRGYILTTAF